MRIGLCIRLASALNLFATGRPGWRIPVSVVTSIREWYDYRSHAFLSYSAIDMSTFEALKLAYLRSTGKDEPGVLALLAFGSISGSVGATMVYPLNLVRTRLQASGSTGHPERYSGISDVIRKTYARDGWRGFYRGLVPTLAKVCPLRPLNLPLCYPFTTTTKCRSFLPFQFPTWCTSRANESGCPFKSFHELFLNVVLQVGCIAKITLSHL
jgi:Mitochondrial carrier protein